VYAWFKAVWPAYLETTKHWVTIPGNAKPVSGVLRTGLRADDNIPDPDLPNGDAIITKALYPVAWFVAQQDLVQAMLANEPKATAPSDERMYWALMLMATIGEGLFAFNVSDYLWGRAFFGQPPWVAQTLNKGVRLPPGSYLNSPSMKRFYTAMGKVSAAKGKLGTAMGSVPFSGASGYYPKTKRTCAAADKKAMSAAGYWQASWDSGGALWRSSNIGPLVLGCGTMAAPMFLSLPLINDAPTEVRLSRWWQDSLDYQTVHIPWSKGVGFKALYNQPLGIIARSFTDADAIFQNAKLIEDPVATAARLALYKAAGSADPPLTNPNAFLAFMASRWSFLSFAYRFDALGDSTAGHKAVVDSSRGVFNYGSPFDPDGDGRFRCPAGFRFIPTLPDLQRAAATSLAFALSWSSGEYRAWGAWFQAIDYVELLQAFQADWLDLMSAGHPNSDTGNMMMPLAHDEIHKIKKSNTLATWTVGLAPALSELGALIDLVYENYASAAANLKNAYDSIQATAKHTAHPLEIFYEMPAGAFLRSGGIPADPGGKFTSDMAFLSPTHGSTNTVYARYGAAFKNIVRAVKAATPKPKMLIDVTAANLIQRLVKPAAKPAAPAVAKKVAAPAPTKSLAWVGWTAVAGSIATGAWLLLRKRGR
jgi:hypothetical protein